MSEKPAKTALEGPEQTPDTEPEESGEEETVSQRLADVGSALQAAEARALGAEEKLAQREKELTDRLARLQADFENFRRRSREDAALSAARGKGDFVRTLIPFLDNLDRALAHADDEGLRLLARQLHASLAAEGLVVLDPAGEVFDAKVHEALASEAREDVESGTVLTVVEKGYALDGKVLRAARVIVAA